MPPARFDSITPFNRLRFSLQIDLDAPLPYSYAGAEIMSRSLPSPDEGGPAPTLRLFSPQQMPAEPWTLRRVWEEHLLPNMKRKRSPRTIEADQETLRKLDHIEIETAADCSDPRTLCPGGAPLACWDGADGERLILQVQERMLESLSAGTVNRHCRVIRKILREAEHHKLLDRLPRFELLPVSRRRAGVVTLDEIDALYRNADAATWPRIPPRSTGDFWRTLLAGALTYGFRTQDATGYRTARDNGLLWDEVCWSEECPDGDVTLLSPHGWLNFQPEKTRRTRGSTLILPLSKIVREHLQLWKGIDEERVFPNGRNKRAFARAWNEIRAAAGVSDDVYISAPDQVKGQKVRSIRKTCSNNWDRTDGRKQLGKWVLGHAAHGTTDTFYTDVLHDLVKYVDRLRLPKAFADADQLRLFG